MNSTERSNTTPRELSPAQSFSKHSKDFLQKWTGDALAIPDAETNALDSYSRHLAGLYQISLETSYLISSAVINAAAGASIQLKGPGANTTVAALNTMLISQSSPRLRLAMEDSFQAVRPYANRMAVARQALTESRIEEVKQQGAELSKQFKELRLRAEKTRSPDNPNLKPSEIPGFDPQWLKDRFGTETQEEKNEKEAALLDQKSAQMLSEATKLFSSFHFNKKPGFFVEGILPEELIESHDLCADGSIFNLDIDATTWMSVARLSPAKSRETGSRLAAGWRASPIARKGEILPASTISSLSQVGSAEFPKFWANRRIEENRLRSILLPANVDFSGYSVKKLTTRGEEVRAFFERTLKILFARLEGRQQTNVSLSQEAEAIFLDFVLEIESIPACSPILREIVQSASSMALRLALLFHLGKGEASLLTPDTMKRACHIAAWCVSGTAHLLLSGMEQNAPGEDDLENEIWVVVAKVRKKGPLSRRELYRTFHDQSSSRHIPTVEKAISRGLLCENEDGSLSVPDSVPQK